jgi:DNA topoisomerase-1
MSILIVTEKPDAARKISWILSGGKAKTGKRGKVSWLEFNWSGDKVYCVGLRGHIVGLDFPPKFKDWNYTDLNELIDAKILTKSTERDVVSVLKDLAAKATKIIIATDYDREGELIGVEALNLAQKVKKFSSVQRAKYSSFTAPEINSSFGSLDKVDFDLADAANARQVIDLIWGAVLTRYMTLLQNDGVLSVGRVQTPTLAKIVERELEIRAFVPEPYWQITAMIKGQRWADPTRLGPDFRAIHEKVNFKKESEAKAVYAKVKGASLSTITDLNSKKQKSYPPAPFDTTQFVKEATILGLSAEKAMKIAEDLYMSGYISYPRTDNTAYPKELNLRAIVGKFLGTSEFGTEARLVDALATIRPTKGKKITVDHPPIYPVSYVDKGSLDADSWKVFDLIVRRFLATLYIPYQYETTTIILDIEDENFRASGAVIIEEGWRAIYNLGWRPPEALPPVKNGDVLPVLSVDIDKKQTQPPSRYSQGGLIQLMEKLGIGTKSTRHNIIKTLQKRGYITGGKVAQATELGVKMIESLQKYAKKVTTPEMTSELEEEMEDVGAGKLKADKVIEDSRDMLRKILAELKSNTSKIKKELGGKDSIGNCPDCGEPVEVRKSKKSGKRFVGCTGYPKCSRTYPLPQKGKVVPMHKACSKCGSPIVKIINGGKKKGGKPWIICVNMGCDGDG